MSKKEFVSRTLQFKIDTLHLFRLLQVSCIRERLYVQGSKLKMETTSTPVVAAAAGKAYKVQQTRVGRGVPDIQDAYTKKCSCYRDKTIVFCRACGYYCNGRIRLKCEQHPRVTFLLDIAECPRCNSPSFLDEYFRHS